MMRLSFILFLLLFTTNLFGQTKAIKFYSRLQNIIKKNLVTGDTLTIDQSSDECPSCTWTIDIVGQSDSCQLNIRPRDYQFDSILIYSYTILKSKLISELENEKKFLKANGFKPKYSASLSIAHRKKTVYYHISYLAGLYYRLRFAKQF